MECFVWLTRALLVGLERAALPAAFRALVIVKRPTKRLERCVRLKENGCLGVENGDDSFKFWGDIKEIQEKRNKMKEKQRNGTRCLLYFCWGIHAKFWVTPPQFWGFESRLRVGSPSFGPQNKVEK